MGNEKQDACRIITPEFRVSHPHVFKPQAMPGTNNAPKFSITMLFDKDSDLTPVKKAIHAAKVEKFGADKEKWPKSIKSPVQDGDGEVGITKKTGERKEGYDNTWVIKASTNEDQQPGVVDRQGKEILKDADFYAGCYARAYVFAYVWEFPKASKKYGVGFILDHVQKTKEGKAFGGKKPVGEVFGALASDEAQDFESEESFA
ncbi:Protein of unknown function DUF2815 [uncultured Caudovirales phage]|uniref:DUF2815 family protein n=1 Tax=uncultured Caudovirales phage TaxID=2100421 RepID=A0A6J5RIT3_9CAUD|nr:Protein of unknown function DUF2815 [uncultured Caudovirales phage]CAB4197420.1 Protein of unknown function DUF2815 [uncultured Caudovirales phage]CAB4210604.1 Protein of unknown function DUF2815 [uncultured Caudovirales phage]